jgi:hypothetical protein
VLRSRRPQRPRKFSFTRELVEISMSLSGTDEVHKTLRRLIGRLNKAHLPYAIVGGLALAAYRYRRATEDVDILLNVEGFAAFKNRFVPKHYTNLPGRPRRFVDQVNGVHLDVLVTGLFPGSGRPGPIAFPDPADVGRIVEKKHVVDLVTLVQLKLAARRWRDFADVVALIRANDLDDSLAQRLHPSVRGDYIECLEEKRREDEYDARQ